MVRSAYALACAIALAGCASSSTNDPPPPVAVSSTGSVVDSSGSTAVTSAVSSIRPGHGLIESISLPAPAASASAGGTAAPSASGPYRVTVRMTDGTVQTLTIDSRAFLVGDRVQITAGGRLSRL